MGVLPSGLVLGTRRLFSESRSWLREDVLGVLQAWEGREGAGGGGHGLAGPPLGLVVSRCPRDARKELS